MNRIRDLLLPATAAIGLCCGVSILCLTLFTYLAAPIAAEFSIGKAQVSGMLTAHLVALMFALPLAGALADRFRPLHVVMVSGAAFAATLWLASLASSPTALYCAFAAAGLFGAGTAPITYARVIVARYHARRGLALGVAFTGIGLAAIVLPPIIAPIAAADGWRAALRAMALLAIAAALIGGMGLGGSAPRVSAAFAQTDDDGIDLAAALRTKFFWIMAGAFLLLGAALLGVVAHLAAAFGAFGLGTDATVRFQLFFGIATIVGRLLGGASMDWLPARQVGAIAALCGAAGALATGTLQAAAPVALIGFLLGFCSGAESDVVSYLVSRRFGPKHFARIYGIQGSLFMLGAALGPILAAVLAERLGYAAIWLAASAALIVSAAGIALLRNQAPERTASTARAA
ncbi:MAG: MFS transporter [Rudaea sp.]|uniref:MFS transporter n=1 Tax=unclassified Rudaea TaxID=2627037 RepID=UPI0010F79059|nr:MULTISPECIES: MFS transporter [unclassified Rudaea]MBN8887684.1 MFS transporter [Rudaea sp.]